MKKNKDSLAQLFQKMEESGKKQKSTEGMFLKKARCLTEENFPCPIESWKEKEWEAKTNKHMLGGKIITNPLTISRQVVSVLTSGIIKGKMISTHTFIIIEHIWIEDWGRGRRKETKLNWAQLSLIVLGLLCAKIFYIRNLSSIYPSSLT